MKHEKKRFVEKRESLFNILMRQNADIMIQSYTKQIQFNEDMLKRLAINSIDRESERLKERLKHDILHCKKQIILLQKSKETII